VNENQQIVSQFIVSAENAGASVEQIESSPGAVFNSLINSVSDSPCILLSEPQYISHTLFKLFIDHTAPILSPDAKQLASADVGITDAFAGVAKTGSVCVSLYRSISNYISLLPKKHIVILESKKIVPRPRDIFNLYLNEKINNGRGLIFISGPSATADMGELVRGAHGPSRLHIILIE